MVSVVTLLAVCLGAMGGPARAARLAAEGTVTPMPAMGMGQGLTSPSRQPVRQSVGSQQFLLLPPSGKSPSWYDVAATYRTLSAARAATAKYASERAALRDGFRRMPGLQAQMYATFVNTRNPVRDARAFDPHRPTSLIYMEMPGMSSLSAVSYTLPGATSPRTLDRVFPASLAEWSRSLNACTASQLLTQGATSMHSRAACAASGWTVNAWVWQTTMGLFEPHPTGMGSMDAGRDSRQIVDMTQEPYQMQMLMATGTPPTWSDISKVYRLLAKARTATQKYRNLAVAKRDGFVTAPFLYVPGQGAHYVNYRLIVQGVRFDETKPPVLVYNRRGGREVLSSLLYLMPDGATPKQLSAIFPASMATWHRHINNCVVGSKVAAIHDRATCQQQGGLWAASTGWMVHAWLWERNVGLFDMDM